MSARDIDPAAITSWAARINAAWGDMVGAILETGRLLVEAKGMLGHGYFLRMVEEELRFSERTAQRLMAIANNPNLSNPTHVSYLPPSWGTLYALTELKLSTEEFAARIADGTINPEMERGEVEAGKARPHVANNSGQNEWYTPPEYLDAARIVLGGFDLDPASSEVANRTVKAARYFTAADDALVHEWPIGRIWLNPPYSKPLIPSFAARLAAEVRRGSSAIVLVNNATDTRWFRTVAEVSAAICFPEGRIHFLNPEGEFGKGGLQGQAVLYAGPAPEIFAAAFARFGLVLPVPWPPGWPAGIGGEL